MKYRLEAIGGATAGTAAMQSFVIASYEKGGAFRHLDKGCGSSVHATIILEAIEAMQAAGCSKDEILARLNQRYLCVGNSSSWRQFIESQFQWGVVDEDGRASLIEFKKRFGNGELPKPDLGLVF